jgi:acyl carrier protein
VTVTLDEIRQLVARELKQREVAANALIIEELGAESIDVMAIVTAIEERYGVTIAESELPDLRSAAAIYARLRGAESSG